MRYLDREWDPGSEALLADGAWGTELAKRGLARGECPEQWNLDNPVGVGAVARDYITAGSDIILTNSFGGSRLMLDRHGLGNKTVEINRIAAELSAEAASGKALVAGSMGPTGKMLILDEVSESALYEGFCEQAAALRDGGVSWLLVETMTDMQEMVHAVKAAVETTGLPVIASMTYEPTGNGYRTIMGNKPEDCVAAARKAGASIVGANCGTGIENYVELAKVLASITDAPLWIKANAGIPELVDKEVRFPTSPEEYAAFVPSLLANGVRIVGGCCGSHPGFIREMRKRVDAFNAG